MVFNVLLISVITVYVDTVNNHFKERMFGMLLLPGCQRERERERERERINRWLGIDSNPRHSRPSRASLDHGVFLSLSVGDSLFKSQPVPLRIMITFKD